jgi:hypothetical protein
MSGARDTGSVSETDRDEMNPSEVVEEIAHLIKNAADLQIRVCTWRVLDANDFKHLEEDVEVLKRDVDTVVSRINDERHRMGLPKPTHRFDYDDYLCVHCGLDRDDEVHEHVNRRDPTRTVAESPPGGPSPEGASSTEPASTTEPTP